MRVFTSTAREKISKNFDSNWLFKFSHHLSDWLNFYTLIINLILSRLYTVMFRGAPCMIMNWPGILFSCIYFQSIFSPRPWIHWAPSSTTPSEKLWEKNTFKFLQTPYLSIRFFWFFFQNAWWFIPYLDNMVKCKYSTWNVILPCKIYIKRNVWKKRKHIFLYQYISIFKYL